MMKYIIAHKQKGFSLIELIVYMAVLVLIIVALFWTLISTTKSYKAIKVTRLMHASALTLLDRLSYEIRSASSVDVGGSVLGVDDGVLSLNKDNDEITSNILFEINNNRVSISEDSLLEGYLTNDDVSVNKMRFDMYTDNGAVLISVEIQLEADIAGYVYTKDFQTSYVVRGSY